MGLPRLLKLLLVASICAAVAVGPSQATATDSLERDGDVIILTGDCCWNRELSVNNNSICSAVTAQLASGTTSSCVSCAVSVALSCQPCSVHLVCAADDNFDWATATGTWMVDIFAPWLVPHCSAPVLAAPLTPGSAQPAHVHLLDSSCAQSRSHQEVLHQQQLCVLMLVLLCAA